MAAIEQTTPSGDGASSGGAPDLQTLGSYIRERRHQLGLTQAQLAKRLGWQQERVSIVENGKYGVPSLPLMARIAEVLGAPLSDILAAVGYPLPDGTALPDGSGQMGGVHAALYWTLQSLLGIQALGLKDAMNQASDLMAEAMGADKVDAFMYEAETGTLVALGTSNTPMGRKETRVGLDRIPIANGGRSVQVFETGDVYYTGHAEEDPEIGRGLVHALGVRSFVAAPLYVGGEIRGVLVANSMEPERFGPEEQEFFIAASRWVGMVAQRAELSEAITRQTAEEARRVVADELVTAVAHDLGNGLTPIKGHVDLLLRRARRAGDERAVADADEASRGIARLQRLIGDLLDVARLDQGIFSLALQPVDLVAITHEVVAGFRSSRAEIEMRAPDELVICADPGRIAQVLGNLVGNAVQHTPSGTPILVSLGAWQDGEEWAVVQVRDEGPGIAEDLLPELFARHSMGPQSHGLGLGLYLARGIAEAHGGALTVKSQLAKGTMFELRIPLRRPAVDSSAD